MGVSARRIGARDRPVITKTAAFVLLLALALPACKILPTASADQKAAQTARPTAAPSIPMPWSPRCGTPRSCPISTAKAGPLPDVVALGRARAPTRPARNMASVQKEGTSPWTLVAKIDGKIVAAEHGLAGGDHRRRRRWRRQGRRDDPDRPGDARHGAARQSRLRLLQHLHQPDRLRPASASPSTSMSTGRCSRPCPATGSSVARSRSSAPSRSDKADEPPLVTPATLIARAVVVSAATSACGRRRRAAPRRRVQGLFRHHRGEGAPISRFAAVPSTSWWARTAPASRP